MPTHRSKAPILRFSILTLSIIFSGGILGCRKLGCERANWPLPGWRFPQTNGISASHSEVILVNGDRGYAVAEMVAAAEKHMRYKYPTFPISNALVTVWIDPGKSTNSLTLYFFHGFGEQSVRMSIATDGSLLDHSAFVAKEH